MLAGLQSVEVITKSNSEIRILFIYSSIFLIIALFSMIKLCRECASDNSNDNKIVDWTCLVLFAFFLTLGFDYAIKKNVSSYLIEDEVVVNKEFFTKTKYLTLDERTIFIANACMKSKAACSKANKDVIFGSVDKELIEELKAEACASSRKGKFVLKLEKFISKA